MLLVALRFTDLIPEWLESPQWIVHLSEPIRRFIDHHQALGLFVVIGAEELGVPIPVPGDIAIMWAGYLTKIHRLSYPLAFLCVVAGATIGSSVLFTISRRVGHGFLVRYGRHVGIDQARLARAEDAFLRWGPWAIVIGRLVPGFRIAMSAFAGTFNVPYSVFVPSVIASSMIWALVFLALGRYLGLQTIALFRLLPAHLFPLFLVLALVLVAYALARRRARTRAVAADAVDSRIHESP